MEEENVEVEVEQRPSSARRTFARNNAARQVAINFMPSRQLPYNTLRLRRNNSEHNALLEEAAEAADSPDASEKQADIIVRELEQHRQLMEDNPVAEELRREALRDLPQGLTMKRHVRAKLSASVSLKSKKRPISFMKRMKYRISFAWKRAGERMRDLIFSIELWYEAIRNIEGHFGSAVGSYFYFLRWLFVLDAALVLLIMLFLVVPQVLHDEKTNVTVSGGPLDFISGMGNLEDSLLFYGHYHDGDIAQSGPRYNMPYAYFFTMLSLFLLFFLALCIRTAYSYRRNFIGTGGGLSQVFANKVFCGWDYGIVTQQAATLNANSIYNEFKELLSEQNKKLVKSSCWVKFGQYLANTMCTLLVIAFIAGLEAGFWFLLAWSPDVVHWEIYVSLIITLALTVCPFLLNAVVRLEFYRPRTAFYVTLARTWLLDVGTLILLLYFWSSSKQHCWETRLGQETYRLVILDAFISLIVLPIIEFLRAFIYQFWGKEAPEFDIVSNSLTLIYNQAVLWLGMLFSPLLVVAVALKFLLLFYVKRASALKACQPARKIWRAAQTQTVLYMLVTLSLFTTLFAVGSLFLGMSSIYCGPFRQYEFVYMVVTEGLLRLSHHEKAREVLVFLTRPGVIAFLVLFLCVCVYYMRAKARAQMSMVTILRHMLVLQAKDKDFLLAAISKVSNGEWLYSPKANDDESPDSHTWKYLREVRKPSNSEFHFDASRLSHSYLEGRPRSYLKDNRPNSYHAERPTSDGDTDSSFSWKGSNSKLENGDERNQWM